jgi:predicted nucleic acid-binding protein
LACALDAEADYFLTTDKKLIAKARAIEEIKVLNPIDFIYHEEAHYEV